MDEDEEDWRTLLDLYLLPAQPDRDADGWEPPDDAPWRTALRAAARQPPSGSNGTGARRAPIKRPAPPTADSAGHRHAAGRIGPEPCRGDRVAIASLAGLRGTVLAVSGELALVETEAARVRVRCSELVVVGGDGPQGRTSRPALIRQPGRDSRDRDLTVHGGSRGRQRWHGIDLHGLKPSEALARLDDFLFTCWDEGRETVAVVHGKGTGALRSAVRAMLAGHPAVSQLLGAAPRSGGDGVTLVQLRRKSELFDDLTPGT